MTRARRELVSLETTPGTIVSVAVCAGHFCMVMMPIRVATSTTVNSGLPTGLSIWLRYLPSR